MVEGVEVVLSRVELSWLIWEWVNILLDWHTWVGIIKVLWGSLWSCIRSIIGFDLSNRDWIDDRLFCQLGEWDNIHWCCDRH